MGFSGKTVLERINSKEYLVRNNLTFENDKFKVTVKKGLITNGASIPWYLWSIIGCPFSGKYVGSAIIHDGLYASHALTQEQADELFNHMLFDNGVSDLKRLVIINGLKYFGYRSYKNRTEESILENKKYVTVKTKEFED